ncbi:MAG: hypothetical protein J6Y13_09585, partial [Treponema sp.]|nr:hypothetical protein [Treponema sp.]
MGSTLRKPSYRYMHVILNQCIRGRMPQAMFAVFLHSTLRVCIYIAGVSLAAFPLSAGKAPSLIAVVFDLAVLLTAVLAGEMLSYGLYATISPLVRNQAASIKDIFSAFTDKSRRAAKSALVFTGINAAAILILGILTALPASPARAMLETVGENKTMFAAALAFLALAAVLTLPFTFSYLILLTKADAGVGQSFAVSWKLLIRQIPHFIGFIIYAGGKELVTIFIIQLLLFVMPRGEGASASSQLIATIASFIGILAEYRALTRGYLAICIYFFSEAGILR